MLKIQSATGGQVFNDQLKADEIKIGGNQ